MDLDTFRSSLDAWLDEHADELTPDGGHSLDEEMAHLT